MNANDPSIVKYTYWKPPENVYPWDQTAHPSCSDEKRKRKPVFCKKKPDWPDYETSKDRIMELFAKNNFNLLQKAENELAYNNKRFTSGEYMFEAWYEAMDYFNIPAESSESRTKLSNDWIAAQDGKGFSLISKAKAQYAGGTFDFNYFFPKRNSPGALVKYLKGLNEANATLDKTSPEVKKSALWYEMKLRIAYQHPKLKKSAKKLLNEASKVWPDYPPIYGVAYAYSSPPFGGSFEAMDEIVKLALNNSKKSMGTAVYPLMLETAKKIRGYRLDYKTLNRELMIQGFNDYKKYLGGNYVTAFWLAQHACALKDGKSARLMYEIHDKLKTRNYRNDEECRKLAFPEGWESKPRKFSSPIPKKFSNPMPDLLSKPGI